MHQPGPKVLICARVGADHALHVRILVIGEDEEDVRFLCNSRHCQSCECERQACEHDGGRAVAAQCRTATGFASRLTIIWHMSVIARPLSGNTGCRVCPHTCTSHAAAVSRSGAGGFYVDPQADGDLRSHVSRALQYCTCFLLPTSVDYGMRMDGMALPMALGPQAAGEGERWSAPMPAPQAAPVSNGKTRRSVEHLSAVQVYKKRAGDRANQRHCRARKQDRVRALEEENADLRARLERLEGKTARGRGCDDAAPAIWNILPPSIPPIGKFDHLILYLTDTGSRDSTFGDILAEITQTTYPSVASLLNPLAPPASSASASLARLVGKHGLWMDITSSAARTAVSLSAHAAWPPLTARPRRAQMMYNICLYVRVSVSRPPP